MTASPWTGSVLELRPRRRILLRREELQNDSARKLFIAILILITLKGLVSAVASGDVGGVVGPFVGAALLLGWFVVVSRRMRLRVSAAEILRTGGLPTRQVRRADVIGVVRVPIETFGIQEGEVDVLVTAEGRALLRLSCRLWEREALDRAWAQVGLGIQVVPQAMTWKQLGDWIPGSTRLFERRPVVFAMLIIGAVTVLAIAAAVAAVAFGS